MHIAMLPKAISAILIASTAGAPEGELRVVAPDVGGGFGQKMSLVPEYVVLVWLARKLKSSVAWTEDRRDWPQTLRALTNGPPVNVSDLHALLVDHLVDLKTRIAASNNDIYKSFWNEDPHGRIERPKPEESCRDLLVGLQRTALLPLGITVEPEGHMAADKRADISVAMPCRKILCELKLDQVGETVGPKVR